MVIQLSCFVADIELKSFKLTTIFLLENIVSIVCFLLGNSLMSEFYMHHFGTLCLFHHYRWVSMKNFFILTHLWRWNRVFWNGTYKIQTPGNYPKESIQIQVLLLYYVNYMTITGHCTLHTMLTIFSSKNIVVNLNDFNSISATKQLNWMAIRNDYGHTWWWQIYKTPILRAPLFYIIM